MYQYPAPGYPKIKMLWKYGGPWIGTMTATNRYAKMYTDESLEFVVSQSIWFEGEMPFADIILPACTNFERWDISEFANCSGYIPDTYGQCNHRVISLQAKCIEPVGETQVGLPHLRACSPRSSASARCSPRARTSSTGSSSTTTPPTCPST